jgi:hypothetical protein
MKQVDPSLTESGSDTSLAAEFLTLHEEPGGILWVWNLSAF